MALAEKIAELGFAVIGDGLTPAKTDSILQQIEGLAPHSLFVIEGAVK